MSARSGNRSIVMPLARALRGAAQVWLQEFRATIPEPVQRWLLPRRSMVDLEADGERTVQAGAVDSGADTVSAVVYARDQQTQAGNARADLSDFRSDVFVALWLPADRLLFRDVRLPRAAEADLANILLRDLESRTPIRAAEVMTGHRIEGRDENRIFVEQVIVKKRIVVEVLARHQLSLGRIASIGAIGRRQSARVMIDGGSTPPGRWAWRATATLGVLGALMIGAAMIIGDYGRRSFIADREAEISAIRRQALEVKRKLDEAAQAVAATSNLSDRKWRAANMRDLIEEITQLLPSEAWLTELRITNKDSTLSGYASGAAGLVPLFRNASHFEGAGLVAPIVIDPVEGRERFSIAVPHRERDGMAPGGQRP
jgi:general secretion pathway protein L